MHLIFNSDRGGQVWCQYDTYVLTMVVVFGQVLGVDEEVMVSVQLPEFAVNYIKVLVREIICDLIDVVLFFQQGECLVRK